MRCSTFPRTRARRAYSSREGASVETACLIFFFKKLVERAKRYRGQESSSPVSPEAVPCPPRYAPTVPKRRRFYSSNESSLTEAIHQEDSLLLHCQVCSRNPIQAPTGSTVRTRFTCKFCIERIWRHRQQVRIRRNVEEHVPEPTADELLAESVLDTQPHDAHEERAISGD